jgi:hypothetical protein
MRTPILLLLVCGSAGAGERVVPARFEVRSAHVQVAETGATQIVASRFNVAARVSIIDAAPDPLARFQAKASLKAASASCGAQGEGGFRDGFEGN